MQSFGDFTHRKIHAQITANGQKYMRWPRADMDWKQKREKETRNTQAKRV